MMADEAISVSNATDIASILDVVARLERKIDRLEILCRETRGLVGPFGVAMPDGSMLVQTIHGNKYLIDPSDMIMAPNLIIYRQWESALSRFVIDACKADTVFVDIGANFGYFTCLAASRIGVKGSGKVFSVEPNPKCLDLLRKNVRINWSMCPINITDAAVSQRTGGSVTLFVPRDGSANASLSAPKANMDGSLEEYEVPLKSIDDIIPDGVAVDLMKIDIEGHEYAALAGARRTLRQSPSIKIILEWSPKQMQDAGYRARELSDLFAELDLEPFRVPTTFANLDKIKDALSPDDLDTLGYGDVLLLHRM